MITGSREIIDKRVECLRSAAAVDDLHGVLDGYGTARFPGTDTGTVIRAVRVVLPQAGISIEHIVRRRHVRGCFCRVGGVNVQHLEDGVGKVNETLYLFVAIGRCFCYQLDRVGLPHHQGHCSASRDGNAVQKHIQRGVAVLGDQAFHIDLAWSRRRQGCNTPVCSNIDVKTAGLEIGS